MVKEFENKNYWALILGGSSGLGLATAKKLAMHGCHIMVVHRNSKTDMPAIEQAFAQIKATGVDLLAFNKDAMQAEKRDAIINTIREKLGEQGKIRALVHSIAKGNLKPMTGNEQPFLQNDDFI